MNEPILRRFFRVAFAGALLFGADSSLADTQVVDGIAWTYIVTEGEATVGGGDWASPAIPVSTTGAISIPDKLGGFPVTTIGDGAFCDCSSVTSVTIRAGVTSIGADAFWRCSGLLSVTIPAGVTNIGYRAFARCTGLASIAIPAGVTSVETLAFAGCSGLTSVTIPDGVEYFGKAAFESCTGLTSVSISAGVSDINGALFRLCSGLLSFSVANGNASYCASNGLLLTKDGKRLVCGVNGTGAVPNGVETIDDCAFEGRFGLTTVSIPGTVTNIGYYAFSGCSGLTAFAVEPDNPTYSSSSGLLLSKDGKTLLCGVNGDVTIPDSVTCIGQGAFSGLSGLKSVTIPDGVTDFDYDTFSDCSGLTSISFGKGLEDADWGHSFDGCSALASITVDAANPVFDSRNGCNAVIRTADNELVFGCRTTIVPDTVTRIGYPAFADCSGLVSIEIPDSVTSIEWGAFENCSNMEAITVPYAFKDVLSASGIPENCRVETRAPLQLAFRTPSAWPDAVTEAQYWKSLDVIGGLRPYRFEIVDYGSWPYWLSSIEDWSDSGDRPWLWGVPGSSDTGTNTFAIRVMDANGTSVTNTFTLVVEKNDAPVIESWTPEAAWFRLNPGSTTNFTVTASDPNGDELSYYWRVAVWDGDDLLWNYGSKRGNVFAFNASAYGEGRYLIEASVSDGGYNVYFTWYVLVAEEARTRYTPVPVPYAWLDGYALGDGSESGYETAANAPAANGANDVWACYVVGLDPTNATSRFFAEIDATVDPPRVTWTPDLNEGGTKSERVYTVEGKTNLVDESWGPTNESTRFYRVKVSLP